MKEKEIKNMTAEEAAAGITYEELKKMFSKPFEVPAEHEAAFLEKAKTANTRAWGYHDEIKDPELQAIWKQLIKATKK